MFDTIELNGTFYSLKSPDVFRRWVSEVPRDFLFAVKGSRFITHNLKLRNATSALANFYASGVLALERMTGPFLWQGALTEASSRVRYRHAFEVRHPSYFTDEFAEPLVGFASMMRRSGAVPSIRSGQHVVSVSRGCLLEKSAGWPARTTRRFVTIQLVRSDSVSVNTVSPTRRSPSVAKWRSRWAEITALPGSPGTADPGR